MKTSFLFLLLFLCSNLSIAQLIASNRIGFKYVLKPELISSLDSNNLKLVDSAGNKLDIKAKFKAYISYNAGVLTVDPWQFTDSLAMSPFVNPSTGYPLKISLNTRKKVGDETKVIKIPYRTWILGFNSIGIKFRPKIKDYNGQEYSTVNTNFGLGISYGYSRGFTTFTHRSVNSWSYTTSLSFGFSSAVLSKEPLKKALEANTNPTNLIVSPSINVTFARNDIGLIVAYGTDLMTGKQSSKWGYQGRGFFGFGLAAGLKL